MSVSGKWRSDVLASLPDKKVVVRGVTFESGLKMIEDAAFNRRMTVEDFVGRAALAFAAYDEAVPWPVATKKEAPLNDKRRHGLPARRLYGRNFGKWQIGNLE